MSTDDPAMQEALAAYNHRLVQARERTRRLTGWGLCAAAAMSWVVSALASGAVLSDPAVAADLDSGAHIRDVAGFGWAAAVFGLLGLVLLFAVVWRGPSLNRWVGILLLLLGTVPVLWLAAFAFLLSV